MTGNRWWQIPLARPDAPVRLICLPHAGGGPAGYAHWAGRLTGMEVTLVRPPGREARYAEPPYTRIGPLVTDLATALRPLLDDRYVLYGHSLGALVGYELLQHLRASGARLPDRLVVSGAEAPDVGRRAGHLLHRLPDDALIDRAAELGGTPPALLANRDLLRLLLPTLRADLEVAETYRWTARPALPVPVHAFHGRRDPLVTSEAAARWQAHTDSTFDLTTLPGGHFLDAAEESTLLAAIDRPATAGDGRSAALGGGVGSGGRIPGHRAES
ncbi:thioesterase domain-containing protein [Micromonospora sp. NBRC 101691]|uniref:thioesterase II family protein n=1 Tax=Micromonospora sp. NBRC 101691 TaxID=3032198 RepID=UPI0024A1898C|nr:thioesterase domain-containing protein [Micromonospora sp. NBRC 101691]GLY22337.1 thioesterase [Micromonospora sp. NBRC 101691]